MKRITLASLALIASIAPALAQMPGQPQQPDPAIQAFVGSAQMLVQQYQEKAQALAAANATIAQLRAAAAKPPHPMPPHPMSALPPPIKK